MVKILVWVGLSALLLVGCGGEADEPTSTLSPTTSVAPGGGETALAVVAEWLDALAIGRYPAADSTVVEQQFILLLAVESYSGELYDTLVEDGISPTVSTTFWESFVLGVRGFTGAGITEVEIVGSDEFAAYGRQFSEIEVTSPRGDLTVVALQGSDGRWRVDLLATFGPGFAPLFNQWVDRLPPDAAEPIDGLRGERPSLQVARDRAAAAGELEAQQELDALLERLAG